MKTTPSYGTRVAGQVWLLQYVYVFITSGFEFERADSRRELLGNLAYIWTDEEMKVKEDERWFEEGKISWGSSFHPSESITECACARLFGVNWPLLSGASVRAAAPQSDASNHCQVDSSVAFFQNLMFPRCWEGWEPGNCGTVELHRREMVDLKRGKQENSNGGKRIRPSHMLRWKRLLCKTEGQTML